MKHADRNFSLKFSAAASYLRWSTSMSSEMYSRLARSSLSMRSPFPWRWVLRRPLRVVASHTWTEKLFQIIFYFIQWTTLCCMIKHRNNHFSLLFGTLKMYWENAKQTFSFFSQTDWFKCNRTMTTCLDWHWVLPWRRRVRYLGLLAFVLCKLMRKAGKSETKNATCFPHIYTNSSVSASEGSSSPLLPSMTWIFLQEQMISRFSFLFLKCYFFCQNEFWNLPRNGSLDMGRLLWHPLQERVLCQLGHGLGKIRFWKRRFLSTHWH